MFTIIIFILGFAIGYWYAQKRNKNKPQMNKKAQELHNKKEDNKQKIIKYLNEYHKITNNDVESLLNVGDTSAYNYLEELEDDGIIRQVGAEGRGVFYRLR